MLLGIIDSCYRRINIISYKNETINNNGSRYIILIILISLTIIISILITFNINKKQDREKIRSAQKTIDGNKEIIESKDKIITNISKKLNDLTPNENFEEAYSRFCETYIYRKIKSSLEGTTILTKNVQDYSKLQLSNKDIISLTKTFNNCFPKAIHSLKEEYASITTSDIKFIILNFMNLNNVEIAVLLGLTYGAANKRSNKIKNIFNIKDDLHQFLLTFTKSNF